MDEGSRLLGLLSRWKRLRFHGGTAVDLREAEFDLRKAVDDIQSHKTAITLDKKEGMK